MDPLWQNCLDPRSHVHACVQSSEIFLHLQYFEHPFKYPHLVSSNSASGASEFNSNVGHRASLSWYQPFTVGDESSGSALRAFRHMYV